MLPLLGGATRVEGLDLLPPLMSLLLPPADANITIQQSADVVASIIQSLCDQVTNNPNVYWAGQSCSTHW